MADFSLTRAAKNVASLVDNDAEFDIVDKMTGRGGRVCCESLKSRSNVAVRTARLEDVLEHF